MRNRRIQFLAGAALALCPWVAGGVDDGVTGLSPRVYSAWETRIIPGVAYVDRVPVRYVPTVVDSSGLRSTNQQLVALSDPLHGWVVVAPTLEHCEALPVRQLLNHVEIPARAAAARRAEARRERIQRQPAWFPAYRRFAPVADVVGAVVVSSSQCVPPLTRFAPPNGAIASVRSVGSLSSAAQCGPVG